jgi:hypothetical protein
MNKKETDGSDFDALHCYAVGDELAFRCERLPHYWVIAKIDKITPTGRIKCGQWELNPNLSIRGYSGWYGLSKGEPVTEDIRNEIKRMKNLSFIRDVKWKELSDQQLSEVVRMVQSA